MVQPGYKITPVLDTDGDPAMANFGGLFRSTIDDSDATPPLNPMGGWKWAMDLPPPPPPA